MLLCRPPQTNVIRMEVEALHPAAACLPRRQKGFALQGPNAAMELTMLQAMRKEQQQQQQQEEEEEQQGGGVSCSEDKRSLFRALLRPPDSLRGAPAPQCAEEEVQGEVEAVRLKVKTLGPSVASPCRLLPPSPLT